MFLLAPEAKAQGENGVSGMLLDDETVRTWIFYAAFLMGSFTLLPGLLAFLTNISPKTIGLVGLPYCLLTMTVSIATYVVPPADMEERGKSTGASGIYRSLVGLVLYGALLYFT